jgi:hypothetical protein
MLAIARTGIAMKQTKIGNRFVVIAGTAPANKKTGYRQRTDPQHTGVRIVVIKNGELVHRRTGR